MLPLGYFRIPGKEEPIQMLSGDQLILTELLPDSDIARRLKTFDEIPVLSAEDVVKLRCELEAIDLDALGDQTYYRSFGLPVRFGKANLVRSLLRDLA